MLTISSASTEFNPAMSNPTEYDWIIIGGGSAGFAAARTGASLGLKTLVVEGGKEVGGLCILRGCMPSKTFLESANRYWSIRRAEEFGLSAPDHTADAQKILARKRKLIKEFADYREEQLRSGKFDFIRGEASFVDANTIEVKETSGTRLVKGSAFLVATGSTIALPEIEGLAAAGGVTSDEALEMDHLPKSAIVLGGGAVALEAAYYWNALGVDVTVLQRSGQILTGTDTEAANALAEALRKQGIKLHCHTKLTRVKGSDGCKTVHYVHDGKECTVSGEALLVALGRKPATASLKLGNAGVSTESGRVLVNGEQQTSSPHIFAAGDVCGPYEVVHIAIQQGELAARNAAKLLTAKEETLEAIDYRLKLFGVFTSPQLASCGASEQELNDLGVCFKSASYPFNDHGKSLVMGETEGFVKLSVDSSTNEILGGTVVGPEAVELIHEIVVAMRFRATAKDLATTPHYHPTLSEIWTYPAEDLAG